MGKTGFMYHESFNWADPCAGSLLWPADKWTEVGTYYENAGRIRGISNLLFKSNFVKEMEPIEPRHATREELLLAHSPEYIDKLKSKSDADGGSVGWCCSVGKDSYDVITLGVGGDLNALDAVMEGKVTNAFCLQRPPGGHAEYNHGYAICVVNHFNIMAHVAKKKYGLKRIMIIDWDNHYKKGIHEAWYNDPSVLYIETNQSGTLASGFAEDVGEGAGRGFNVPIPMPTGTGDPGFIYAFENIIVPIADQYKPELILVVAGYAANMFDWLTGQNLTPQGYKKLAQIVKGIADKHCNGRMVAVMEGGFGPSMPFCVLRTLEAFTGKESVVKPEEVPFEREDQIYTPNDEPVLMPDQIAAVDKVKKIQSEFWKL